MKSFKWFAFCTLIFSAIFSCFSIYFSGDVALFAFFVAISGTLVSIYFTSKVFIFDEAKFIPVMRKLFQYLPYILLVSFILRRAGKNGTAYWYDVATVILWCAVFLCSLVSLFFMHEKRVYGYSKNWQAHIKQNPAKKPRGALRFLRELSEWADALVQAVFMFLLIQIFVLQLYVIPSESMVPQFLVGDRVFVFKTSSGPKFPLSDIGLPEMRNYKRGDVVVFRNPHYKIDRKSEVQTVTSQIIYMLTFTLVNLNRDENGEPKADPLVKRICGVPGEQLVMQDGTLYARTKNSTEFFPVETDAKFASWNLHDVPANARRAIRSFPLSAENYNNLLEIEKARRELNLANTANECQTIAVQFQNLLAQIEQSQNEIKLPASSNVYSNKDISLFEYDLFSQHENIFLKLFLEKNESNWFSDFMTDWIFSKEVFSENGYIGGDIYSDANFKLNLMAKILFGKIILCDAERFYENKNLLQQNEKLINLMSEAEKLHSYIMYLDQRNMPLFPPNENGSPRYLEDGNYFMMGDNRFNSLDMRHSYNFSLVPLSRFDNFSVTYYSNIAPQAVNKKLILGDAIFCFWPLSRIGMIKTKM